MKYKNENAREISFPLGGIGAGSIGLAGNGQLIDVEIFNAPNKGSVADFSHFCIKAEQGDKVIDQRVLQGDYLQSYTGAYNGRDFNCYGFGPNRASMAGLPNFEHCEFEGRFPMAKLSFDDEKFPGNVTMEAFNPFIPTNEDDSSIPAAFFEFEVKNDTDTDTDYSIAFSMANMFCSTVGVHSFKEYDDIKSIHMSSELYGKDDLQYGDMTISTDCDEISYQQYWFRGKWFDNLSTFWNNFKDTSRFVNRVYDSESKIGDPNLSTRDIATLAAHVCIKAGCSKKVRFVLSWNMPNNHNYWNSCADKSSWKNYYATVFENSLASGRYSLENYARLYHDTKLFTDTLFSSSIPPEAIEAVSANLAIIKSPTCLRLEDGSLYGFEGTHCCSGCCEGSCTHVWSYAYSIPFLFPKLERSMRTLEYKYNMDEHGGMAFRLMLPLGSERSSFRPCVDGQYATVMRIYREFKISGDIAWLKNIWPQVKNSIEYAWSPNNSDGWDADKDGLMEGRQHHTLDMELFGHSSWLSGVYLGGLKAGIEIAKILGDVEAEKEYSDVFESGRTALNDTLFNGEYFIQKVDLKDQSILQRYTDGLSMQNETVEDAYWNNEVDEIQYQTAEGCALDQLLGQFHADMIGLGKIFDDDKVEKTLSSIYKNNFIKDMRNFVNPCRIYCLNDEQGLIICAYPDGVEKPYLPAPYAEETMHGFEYQAAIHMIKRGMMDEGMECIKALRKRYDGTKRNPWNEFECGSNYARSMASYALLLAYSGFEYDMHNKGIGFNPKVGGDFSCFWSLDSGWGKVEISDNAILINVLYGQLELNTLMLPKEQTVKKVVCDDVSENFTAKSNNVLFENTLNVKRTLLITY